MTGPLTNIKVLEIAGIGPGPVAGMMLADLGADVITVERLTHETPTTDAATANPAIFNRGKRSVALDLKQPEAVAAVLKLISTSDMLIEGFRPGVMERLGLGPDVCLEHNPKLVYGRMTGWGQYGPLSMAAGHDPNYIAVSGALWPGGDAETPPTAPLTLVGDVGGGTMILIMGLLSAYISASNTGVGQVVDAAITDGSAYISTLLRFMHNTGQMDDQAGSGWANFGAPWNRSYRCADGGFITVCALETKFYQELLTLLDLDNDPTFANQWDTQQWAHGRDKLERLFASRTRAAWNDRLEGSDACYAPVLNLSEAVEHPHNVARETFIKIDGFTQPSPAPKFSKTPAIAGKVPYVGEDTLDVLHQLGLSNTEIDALSKKNVRAKD